MPKVRSSSKRNIEIIRRKNVEDNQLFLEQLLMTTIRNDFVKSARSILRKDGSDQIRKHFPRPYQRVERATRYNEKVKSGEIPPHVPEWQRDIERKRLEKEQERKEKEMRRQAREIEKQERQRLKEIERQEKERENELKRQAKEIERQEKEREREVKRQAMEIERREKRRTEEMEREERLFVEELKKIERILKFEEEIKIKRAERHHRYGLSKWELSYSDPQRSLHNLRRTELNR